jgi:transcriptional regulator with XRE-family HTH domain
MSVHALFADNLRHACMRHPSIAAVCAGIGINRQQFNKYLAGSALPNAITLRRICGFLDVREQELFQARSSAEPMHDAPTQHTTEKLQIAFMQQFTRGTLAPAHDLQRGAYFSYFPLHHVPGMLLRGLVIIQRDKGTVRFTRLTVIPSSGKANGAHGMGKHRGVVLSGGEEFYFLGSNVFPPCQLSLMTMQRVAGSRECYRGITVTRNGRELISPQTCLSYCDQNVPLRELVRQLGFVHCQKSELNSVFLAELLEQRNLM